MKPLELLLDEQGIDLALTRITHQILERNRDTASFGVVGMHTRGVFLARRIVAKINQIAGLSLVAGALDVTLYRDDFRKGLRHPPARVTDIPFDISGANIVLVDDVLFTGRTVRAALDALIDFGRPKTIQLAVLVDRGCRELPIRADYVGKKITTAPNEAVSLKVKEHDGEDSAWLMLRE